MQFFTILLVNIFTGAVIYLLLSLKLARSSAEYREQRLRREMDEIIKEFNSTANRNISLLENKIAAINRLFRQSGSIQGIDVTVSNDELVDNHTSQDAQRPSDKAGSFSEEENVISERGELPAEEVMPKKSLPEFFVHGISAIRSKIGEIAAGFDIGSKQDLDSLRADVLETVENKPDPYEKLIEKDLSSLDINDISDQKLQETEEEEVVEEVKESDVMEILSSESDRFAAVAELSDRGCSIEMIAKYCNMPAGEVRLILNLQK